MQHCYIIAEIGINHNGDVALAKKLALMAKECGCDFVKLQKRTIDWCYSEDQLSQACESPWGTTIRDKVVGRELSWDQIEEFDRYCKHIEMPWFASCFDLNSLHELHNRYPKRLFNKIPSCMADREKFLDVIADQKLPVIVSPGLINDVRLDEITGFLTERECLFIVNHCVSLYPCPPERLNLRSIKWLMKKYSANPHCIGIGYSGHEVGLLPSIIAASIGAMFVERHVTLDRTMYGSDQAASVERQGLERMVRDIRSLKNIMGVEGRELHGDEKNPVTFWRDE
jgi:N-acetylneuraminate synthase